MGVYLFIGQTGRFWPIVLKKSVLVSMAQKYASEIEILNRRRDTPDSDFT